MRVRITQQFFCGAAALADYASSPPPAEDGLGYVVTTNTGDYTTALTNIKLNGAPIVAVVSSWQTVALTLNYQLWNHPTCANCIMQAVIGVGATAHSCVYDGVPGVSPGVTGTSTINITAPTTPGTYEIRYRQNLEFNCGTAKTQYNSFPPGTSAAIGTIIVKP